MVYGFGKRIEADRIVIQDSKRALQVTGGIDYAHHPQRFEPILQVQNVRKWYSISVGHLQRQIKDLAEHFGAECGVENCQGLLHPLESLQKMLVLGQENIHAISSDYTLSKKKLVTLHANDDAPDVLPANLPVWQIDDETGQEELVGSLASLTADFTNLSCSYVADTYVNRLQRNHLYLDKLQQTMYTSVMNYLFQNASVRNLNASRASVQLSSVSYRWTHMVELIGSYRVVTFKATVPYAAALQTSAGVAVVFIIVVFLVMRPEKRLAVQEPKQVGEVVHDDAVYPKALLTCLFVVFAKQTPKHLRFPWMIKWWNKRLCCSTRRNRM